MINFKTYNPIPDVEFKNIKNPYAKKLAESSNDIKLHEAISDINKRGGNLLIDNWYYISNKETYELLNGANIICTNGGFITDFDGVFMRLKEQYNTESIINISYKINDHKNRYWWVQKGEKEPRNKTSVGIEYVNCRKNELKGSLYGFTKGIHLKGDNDGVVSNRFNLQIRNCRYGIFNQSRNRGWSNQNYFTGSIQGDGFVNRDPNERTESAMIWNEGNGQRFDHINMEGAESNYQYTIYETSPYNSHNDCRYERSVGKGMFHLYTFGSNITNGYGYAPNMMVRLGRFYDPEGKIKKKGFVHKNTPASTFSGNGNLVLGGNKAAIKGEDHPTLIVSNQHHKYNTLQSWENKPHKKKMMLYSDGTLVLNQGNDNFIDLKEHHKRIGIYKKVNYKSGEYYTWGDWFDDRHFALDLFIATSWNDDKKNIGVKPRSVSPIVMKDGCIYAKAYKNIKDLKQ